MAREFHRPTMLDIEAAEQIIGDDDPAIESELAHATAWALMGIPSGDFSEDDLERVRAAVRTQGVDVLASAWSRSPEFTLPGALWRLHLLDQWNQMDASFLQGRYDQGLAALGAKGQDVSDEPQLSDVVRAVTAVLNGYGTDDDLAPVLASAAEAMRVLAASVEYGADWITDDTHPLAFKVTRRPSALLATAEELDESATRARAGQLS